MKNFCFLLARKLVVLLVVRELMAALSSASSSTQQRFPVKVQYQEEGDGLTGDNWKVFQFLHPAGEPVSIKRVIQALYDNLANIKELQAIRASNGQGEWWLIDPHTSFAGQGPIFLRMFKTRRPVPWLNALLSDLENNETRPATARSSPAAAAGVVSLTSLRILGEKIARNWGDDVAVPLMRGLKSLALPTWQRAKPSGILFHGPPGTGKSSLCRQLMNSLSESRRFILFSGVAAQLNERYVGEAEKRLKALADVAVSEPDKLFFLFIDEVHGLAQRQSGSSSGSSSQSGHNAKQDLLLSLLEVMTGYPNVIFMFATNFLAALDPAFLRSKRIDLQVFVPPHSFQRRLDYIRDQIEPLLQPIIATTADGGRSMAARREIRSHLLAVVTTNFSMAQFDSLLSRLETENEFPQFTGPAGPDVFWDSSAERSATQQKMDVDRCLQHISEVATYGGEQTKKFTQTFLLQASGLIDSLQQWLSDANQAVAKLQVVPTGRKVIFAQSGLVGMEGPSTTSELAFWQMPVRQDERSVSTVLYNMLISLHPINYVHVIDGEFRNKHQDYLDEALDAVYQECQQQRGHSMIVVEMDDIIGLVAESSQFSTGFSTTLGQSTTDTQSCSLSLGDTWNLSSGLSHAFGRSDTRGTSSTEGTSTTLGKTHGQGSTSTNGSTYTRGQGWTRGENWGDSQSFSSGSTFGTGEAYTTGSSVGHTSSSGFSAGLSLAGPSLGFNSGSSTTTSQSNSATRSWNSGSSVGKTDGVSSGSSLGSSTQLSCADSLSLALSSNSSISQTSALSQTKGANRSNTTSSTDTSSSTESVGHSETRLHGLSIATSQSLSKAATTSQATTLRMQYPRAAHSVTRLLNRINRAANPNDPNVIIVYRVTEPPVLNALPLVPDLDSQAAPSTPRVAPTTHAAPSS